MGWLRRELWANSFAREQRQKGGSCLRVFDGGRQDASAVAAQAQVSAEELKEIFVESGRTGLKGSGSADAGKLAKENARLRSQLGELLLERELEK